MDDQVIEEEDIILNPSVFSLFPKNFELSWKLYDLHKTKRNDSHKSKLSEDFGEINNADKLNRYSDVIEEVIIE